MRIATVSGIRDYIHVMDLASGHVAALNYLGSNQVGLKVSDDSLGFCNS